MLQFIIPTVNLIEVNNISSECKHIQQSLIILGMCDMTQTKRKRSVIATGDLHLRESLSIPLLRCDFVDLFTSWKRFHIQKYLRSANTFQRAKIF